MITKALMRLARLFLSDKKAFNYQVWMIYNRYKINTIKWFFNKISLIKNDFVTIHARPVFAENIGTWSDKLFDNSHVAIVMQGQLISEFDFTLETVKLYKKHFINTDIILSVIEGSDPQYIERIEKAGAIIVKNQKPEIAGIGNINMQLVTTMGGLKMAKKMGAQYVYKTRTDQRMNAVNINEYLVNLLTFFPVKGGFKQNKRIVASGFGSLKYVPYLLTDVWVFGQIDDMLAYWGLELENRPPLSKPAVSVSDLIEAKINESYICSEFLKKSGRDINWTIEDWWNALADQFVIVDKTSLDLFFYKYNFYNEYSSFTYEGIKNDQALTFLDWFNMYSNLKNKKSVSEEAVNLPRRDSIIPEKYGN